MPIGINFKRKDKSYTHLRLAGVESDLDKEHQMESDINYELQSNDQKNDQTNQENMDITKIHEILQESFDFHTANTKHNAYVPNNNNDTNEKQNQNIQPSLDNQIIYDYDTLPNLFENPEEEILFNYDEIDEDELDEESNNEVNNKNNMGNHQTDNEERKDNQEYNEYNNKVNENINEENEKFNQPVNINSRQKSVDQGNMRTRQPNRKYQDFHQFIMNQETNEDIDMEVKVYDKYDAKIISMLM